MLIQITEKTSTEELVRAGASPDGKIIQQAIFIQAGLNAPVSFFYDSSIVKKSGDKFVIDNRLDALVAPYADKNYEYQVRTEGSYEANRAADYFSESRTGLTAENLIENIIGVVVDSENIRQVVGLIQIVPPKSFDRNIAAGLAQIITENGTNRFYANLHRGPSTYVARAGVFDATLDVPLDMLDEPNLKQFLKYKSKPDIFLGIAMNLRRFGVLALTKQFKILGLASSIDLPWNSNKNRSKKEYEYSNRELQKTNYTKLVIKTDRLIDSLTKDTVVKYIADNLQIVISPNMNLEQLLIVAGAYLISKSGDKYNSTKNEIELLMAGAPIKDLFSEETLQLIVQEIFKLDRKMLFNHLASFSVVINEITEQAEVILWDMPLDKQVNVTVGKTLPINLGWITSVEQSKEFAFKQTKEIGINLEINDSINMDLQTVLNVISKNKQIETIYIKYSLLSHLATIIREYGFNVISI